MLPYTYQPLQPPKVAHWPTLQKSYPYLILFFLFMKIWTRLYPLRFYSGLWFSSAEAALAVPAVWQGRVWVSGAQGDGGDSGHDSPEWLLQVATFSVNNSSFHKSCGYFRDESVRRAEEMFHQLDNDGNGDLTEVRYGIKRKKCHTKIVCNFALWWILVTQDEFVMGCMQDEVLVKRLSSNNDNKKPD